MGTVVLCIIAVPFCLWFYFLPCIKAVERRTRMYPYVLMLNLFLGWTVIGWWLAMAWAFEPGYRMRDDEEY